MSTYRRIPAEPADWFSPEEVQKAKDYQRPLTKVKIVDSVINTLVILAILATHAVPRFLDWTGLGPWPLQVVAALAFLVVVSLPFGLPTSIWVTFVHEQKWGFNTQTPKGFVVDLLKGVALNTVLLSVLLIPVWAVIRATELWWVWAWGVMFFFSIGLAMLYPILIAPVFNKFNPLDDEALVERLRSLARRAGLSISEFLVMDASKRTRKDNAYFAGLGKTRRVVLFDNLLEQPHDAVEMVVAHEMGHWRRKHIARSMPLGALLSFVMFFAISRIMTWPSALEFAGVDSVRDPGAIPLFLASFVPLNIVVSLIQAWVSRAFERQADLEALDLTHDPDAYRQMQRELHTRNLAELAPNTWKYIRSSHPPAAERLELSKLWESSTSRVRAGE